MGQAVKKIIRDEGFFIVHRDVFKLSRSTAQLFYAEHEGLILQFNVVLLNRSG